MWIWAWKILNFYAYVEHICCWSVYLLLSMITAAATKAVYLLVSQLPLLALLNFFFKKKGKVNWIIKTCCLGAQAVHQNKPPNYKLKDTWINLSRSNKGQPALQRQRPSSNPKETHAQKHDSMLRKELNKPFTPHTLVSTIKRPTSGN